MKGAIGGAGNVEVTKTRGGGEACPS